MRRDEFRSKVRWMGFGMLGIFEPSFPPSLVVSFEARVRLFPSSFWSPGSTGSPEITEPR